MAGTPITLAGIVLTRSCRPVAGALVDLWHADDSGEYDNEGFRLRGHQFTNADGRYAFETILPGLYPGRTRHFHVKYQAANQPVLTTQLYFPGEPGNEQDRIFDPALMLRIEGGVAMFTTVLNLA
jgi:protocatechuate 3,4-dioxygenase beta subunit